MKSKQTDNIQSNRKNNSRSHIKPFHKKPTVHHQLLSHRMKIYEIWKASSIFTKGQKNKSPGPIKARVRA